MSKDEIQKAAIEQSIKMYGNSDWYNPEPARKYFQSGFISGYEAARGEIEKLWAMLERAKEFAESYSYVYETFAGAHWLRDLESLRKERET